jgi:hypothetical protein
MKELKFRTWDKYHKVFLIHSDIHVFIQQYTGIKDAKGNEVYEGDILQDDDGFIDLVKYNEEGYYHAGDWDGSDFKYCKVIGNIYENPELLENQK